MFAKQRLVMRAAGVSVWLLAPAMMLGVLVSCLYIATAVCNAMLFNELLSSRRVSTVVGLIIAIAGLLLIRPLLEVSGQLLQNRAGLVVKSRLRQALLEQLDARGPMRGGLGVLDKYSRFSLMGLRRSNPISSSISPNWRSLL